MCPARREPIADVGAGSTAADDRRVVHVDDVVDEHLKEEGQP
jgi:hypothetical protein